MEELWHSITSGAAPLIMSALAVLLPALTTFALTWLKAQTALQDQAIRAAVDHVDALQEAPVDLSRTMAKRMAMGRVQDQLNRPPSPEKLSAKIDAVVAEKRRESMAPGVSS